MVIKTHSSFFINTNCTLLQICPKRFFISLFHDSIGVVSLHGSPFLTSCPNTFRYVNQKALEGDS